VVHASLDKQPLIYVFISAALFGISAPLAKLLVKNIPPVALAGFLYFGSFAGLFLYSTMRKIVSAESVRGANLRRRDFPWLLGAILSGGIIAPVCLMFGLNQIKGDIS
jgi:drug/metabolite transporter (DMT)-like permease